MRLNADCKIGCQHNVERCGASVLMCLHDTKSKNFKNNIPSMADVSLNDHACFNHYSEASSSVCPSDSDFPPIENPIYQNQLRVLNVLDESFEIEIGRAHV